MKKHIEILNNTAYNLDVLTLSKGEIIELVDDVTNKNDEKKSLIILLNRIKNIINSNNFENKIKKIAMDLYNNIVYYYGYKNVEEICSINDSKKNIKDDASLEELLTELNSLVGLSSVKEKVNDLISYQKVNKLRKENNLHSSSNTLHLSFTGNPGTGKTTVARIVGRIYKRIGLLSKGHFIEASRTDLIAGYQGQTALKVKSLIEKSKGGVLFIDEAYSITENENYDSYGRECLTELTKALEDYREDLVVIVAGYTEPMEKFFNSNVGLKSRFNTFIEFEDYRAEELYEILLIMCKNNDYILDEELSKEIKEYLIGIEKNKKENFSNARMVRNVYEDLVMNHARRISKLENYEIKDLSVITIQDFNNKFN